MVSSTLNNQQQKRDITVVMAISLAALFGILISCVLDVVFQLLNMWYGFRELERLLVSVIVQVVCLISPALLVFYVFRYHQNAQQSPMIAIIYGVLAIRPMIANFMWLGLYYREDMNDVLKVMFSVDNLIYFAAFAVAALSLVTHFAERIIPLVATIVTLLFNFRPYFVVDIFRFFIYGGDWQMLYLAVSDGMWCLGLLALYAALLVIIFRNHKSATAAPVQDYGAVVELSPEQELKNLEDNHDLGLINDKEYQEQKKEIQTRL